MSKVYESDINPDEFIRSFREEPSRMPAAKKKKERLPDRPFKEDSDKNVTETEEDDFVSRFVRNMEHMRPIDKYLMVEIHPEFIRKVKRILSYESGQVCSLKAYINNVLGEHFKEYAQIINKRL